MELSSKRETLLTEKRKVSSLSRFKNRCYVCWKKFGKYFTFHHLWYVEGEPYHADYQDNTDYQLAVLPYVRKNPKQFLLLCRAHHKYVEWGKSIKNEAMWKRFCIARKLSQ